MEEPKNEYRPLSSWGYVGYNLLFAIPLVGFICMIVFALDSSYIARRNYARSFLIWMLIGLVLSIILTVIFMVLGISMNNLSYY